MSGTTYQVITHGKFAELTDEQRASLVAQAGDHDLFKARFTEEGTVTYEPALLTFTFRVLIPATDDDTEELVLGQAEELAAAAVQGLGGTYRDLRSVSTDLSKIKIKRKGR
ncbi:MULTISPECIES: DUF6204 family protein [Kitasatospora]|uniref:Uncharacterized protein n=1 Tax=Kitasatospora setae (strain ATCC 33774 / DSM 43861 / JCM 3304 / KCC A-0304 / NBRC 14216 / KM-6054) TaxID=452652 RepID=E4NIL2_KITSK|nr:MULTISPECIES: DUF6204 family protein [Kitasatospora]BAJ32810.1 hypothetical protein KSE_70520 [Kitasatospora setae KM-6054]